MADDKDKTTDGDSTAPAGTLTQADVDRIVGERLAREKAAEAKRLKGLGYDSWEALEASRKTQSEAASEAEKKRAEELLAQSKFQPLYEAEKKKREEREAELTRQLTESQTLAQQSISAMRAERMQREIVAAASAAGAVAPDQIAALLTSRVTVDETGALAVLGADGKPATDGKGNALGIAQLVAGFMADNPHFARAASGQGGSSQPAGGGGIGAADLKKVLESNNPAEIMKHKDQILAAYSKSG